MDHAGKMRQFSSGKIKPDVGKKFLPSAKFLCVLCDPPSLLFNGYPVSSPGVKRPKHETKQSST